MAKPQERVLEKAIRGALHEAIQAHGPITEQNIHSAVKRVLGQVRAATHQAIERESDWEIDPASMQEVIRSLQKKVRTMKYGHARTVSQLQALQEKVRAGG